MESDLEGPDRGKPTVVPTPSRIAIGGASSSAGPDPEAPPRPARAARTPGPRAAAGEFSTPWGQFTLSEIRRGEDHVGWGANCLKHADATGSLRCTKSITFGKGRNQLSNDDCIAKMKMWLLQGFAIPEDDPLGRTHHVLHIDGRSLPVLPFDELDRMLRTHGMEP